MEYFDFWFIATLAIIFGSCPCRSDKVCTDIKIVDCVANNLNHTSDCFFSQKIVACVNHFIDDCLGVLLIAATNQVKDFTARAAECPGLPDGQCLHGSMKECLRDLVFDNPGKKGERLTRKQCQFLKSNSQATTHCLNGLKQKCKGATSPIDDHLRFINEASKTCAGKFN